MKEEASMFEHLHYGKGGGIYDTHDTRQRQH